MAAPVQAGRRSAIAMVASGTQAGARQDGQRRTATDSDGQRRTETYKGTQKNGRTFSEPV